MLERWDGEPVRLLTFTRPHATLVVAVGDPVSGRNLVVYCLEPTHICGPFAWAASHLRVALNAVSSEEAMIRLIDEDGSFEVQCASLEIKENVKV